VSQFTDANANTVCYLVTFQLVANC